MGTAKQKAGTCVHENIFSINIAPGHVPVPGPASAANNPGPGSVRPRRPRGLLWQNRVKTAAPKLISSLFFCPLRLLWKKCRGRPIFHRLRVSKLSKTSHPSHVIAMYGYIEYHRVTSTNIHRGSYPTMYASSLEWLV